MDARPLNLTKNDNLALSPRHIYHIAAIYITVCRLSFQGFVQAHHDSFRLVTGGTSNHDLIGKRIVGNIPCHRQQFEQTELIVHREGPWTSNLAQDHSLLHLGDIDDVSTLKPNIFGTFTSLVQIKINDPLSIGPLHNNLTQICVFRMTTGQSKKID